MTNRLDQITTRTGDDGSTGLADGSRHLKSSPRFVVMGDVDELNSHIGLLRSYLQQEINDNKQLLNEFLIDMQHHLFEIGSELAVPGMSFLSSNAVQQLDDWSNTTNAKLPALKEFILPSGTLAASQAHVCRSVTRRAERSMVQLRQAEAMSDASLHYLNRCSDVFFVMSRILNQNANQAETLWRGNATKT